MLESRKLVFDNSKNNIMVKSVSEITDNIGRRNNIEQLKSAGETIATEFVEKAGPLSAVALTAHTVKTYRSNPNDEYEKHGGTSTWS